MWRCKLCGFTKFEIERSVMCCRCYNQGKDIRDIATWEDEDERY